MLESHGFNFPICLSGLIYLTQLACTPPPTMVKFQSLETEYLPPEVANLDAKISAILLLHIPLCLLDPQFQCHLFIF